MDHPVKPRGLLADGVARFAEFENLAFPNLSLGRCLPVHQLFHNVKPLIQLVQRDVELRRVQDPVLHLRQLLTSIVSQLATLGKQLSIVCPFVYMHVCWVCVCVQTSRDGGE